MIVKTSSTFNKRLITAVTLLGISLIFNSALAESTTTRTAGGLDLTAIGGKRQGREVPQSLRVKPGAKHPVWKTQSTNQTQPAGNQPNSGMIRLAQKETQNATNDENSTASEKEADQTSSDEKKESGGVKKRPLKDFRPSEQIEAEQAVDFPYDI
jgi:hypothetical protein